MSSQDESGILFEVSNASQNLRLVELPSSLLEKFRSSGFSRLTIKSADPETSVQPQESASHAVLCTDDQTFQIRQVQSSNSVFIAQPSDLRATRDDVPSYVTSISAISQCSSTLELVPVTPRHRDFLKKRLPTYNKEATSVDDEVKSSRLLTSGVLDKATLLIDSPFSEVEFEKAWKELCCFEFRGQAFAPSAQSLLGLWDSVLSEAVIQSLDLESDFLISTFHAILEDVNRPVPLLEALLLRLSVDDELMNEGCTKLDIQKVVRWVGTTLLQSSKSDLDTSQFMDQWQDRLPESRRSYASLKMLQGNYSHPTKTTIVFQDTGATGSSALSAAHNVSKPNRKWHEKFKNARR